MIDLNISQISYLILMGVRNKIQISITISKKLLSEVEKARGRVNRSVYLGDIVAEYFEKNKKKTSVKPSKVNALATNPLLMETRLI